MGFLRKAAALLFPARCPFCSALIEAEDVACENCLRQIKEKHRPILRGVMGYRCVSSFLYDGRVRKMLVRIKFYEQTQFIRQAAVILAEDIRTAYGEYRFDLITYVPMHPKDQRKRGYNQSQLLCSALSKELNIPSAGLLNKIKQTKKQHTLTWPERRKNLSGAFRLTDRNLVKGKNILIVDDIVTSGCTLGACCRKLNEAKPAVLCCAAIADAGERHDASAVI